MLRLTRWCIAHRRWVVGGWVAIAIVSTLIATAVGRQYATNFSLPGTEAQHVVDLLNSEFKAQSGDVDTIVFHTSNGTVDSHAVQAAIDAAARAGEQDAARRQRRQPLRSGRRGRDLARPADGVRDDQLRQARQPAAQQRPASRCWTRSTRSRCRGLTVAAGGQVIEQRRGLQHRSGDRGRRGRRARHPAVDVRFADRRRDAADHRRASGLITGVALIGLATHITDMSNVAPELALMIGLGVGVDYALFIVTRFRENYKNGAATSTAAVIGRDGHLRAARSCLPGRRS